MSPGFIPSGRAFALLGLTSAVLIFAFVEPLLGWLALGLDAIILALVVVDGRRARALPITLSRELPATVHQGEPLTVSIVAVNEGEVAARLRVREVLAPELVAAPVDIAATLPPGSRARRPYTVTPRLRGLAALAPVSYRLLGPWGLCWIAGSVSEGQSVKVYPRVHLEGEAGLLLKQASRRRGANPVSVRGISTELYALREYLPGDDYRRIHWKASARSRRPVTRENTWEQHQHVVALVDCGRPMASLSGVYSKLDHTLAAVLALLRVVVARNDSATLVLFSKEIRHVVRVTRRTASFAPIFERVYAERADLEEPDYAAVVAWCSRRVPRRSLALVCTSVLDLVTAETLGRALVGLSKRHRPLLVNLEDPGLVGHALSTPSDLEGAYAKVSAMGMARADRILGARLRGAGVDVLPVSADRIAVGMIQKYLDLKSRQL